MSHLTARPWGRVTVRCDLEDSWVPLIRYNCRNVLLQQYLGQMLSLDSTASRSTERFRKLGAEGRRLVRKRLEETTTELDGAWRGGGGGRGPPPDEGARKLLPMKHLPASAPYPEIAKKKKARGRLKQAPVSVWGRRPLGPFSWEPPNATSKRRVRDPLPLVRAITQTDEELAARQRLSERPKGRRWRNTIDTATQRVLAAAQSRSHLSVTEAVETALLDGLDITGGNMVKVLEPALTLAASFDDFLVVQTVIDCASQADRNDAGWLEVTRPRCWRSLEAFKLCIPSPGNPEPTPPRPAP